MLFEKLGFKKSINGLSIGDTIYMDHSKNMDIITEFIEKELYDEFAISFIDIHVEPYQF